MQQTILDYRSYQPTDSTPRRRALVMALLGASVVFWIALFGPNYPYFLVLGPWGWQALVGLIAVVAGLLVIPSIRRTLLRCGDTIRTLAAARPVLFSVAAAVISGAYLLLTAWRQHRDFTPYLHDEFSYLIQAQQLAHGRLWMPAHSLAPFFDSFQLIVQPVYASAYFPGTALLYVPGIWLHLPPWVTSLVIAAVVAGLLCYIVIKMIDGVAGVVAVILLLSCQMFRELSLMVMAQTPMLMYGLLAVVVWLRWRDCLRKRWLVVMGFFLGMAAITRPVDTLCFAVPLGLAIICGPLLAQRAQRSKERKEEKNESFLRSLLLCALCAKEISVLLVGIVPPLLLQLIFNFGVTGRLLETPFRFYADRDHPDTSFGFHTFNPQTKPVSDLPQKLALYREYQPLIAQHQLANVPADFWWRRLPLALNQGSTTPFPLMAVLLPLALAGLTIPRAAMLAVLPLFLGFYAFYVFFLPHYVIVLLPSIILGILLGVGAIADAWPRAGATLSLGLYLFIAVVAIAALPEFDATVHDEMFDAPLIWQVDHQLATAVHAPAIVLFEYDPKRNVHEEPVYNADVAWPDDAPIIRANDRGAQNIQLFSYYANRQPQRRVYMFNEQNGLLLDMGNVKNLGSNR
jgi:MFS family permease